MLLHSSPLELAHLLLNVELMPFGSVSTEDRELMQLKTVPEGHSRVWMPPYGHLTIYSSPQVMLVHLAANPIQVGLWVTGQEIPQKLILLGNSLVVSLLSFFKHLLDVTNLNLVGLLIFLGGHTLRPSWLLEIL